MHFFNYVFRVQPVAESTENDPKFKAKCFQVSFCNKSRTRSTTYMLTFILFYQVPKTDQKYILSTDEQLWAFNNIGQSQKCSYLPRKTQVRGERPRTIKKSTYIQQIWPGIFFPLLKEIMFPEIVGNFFLIVLKFDTNIYRRKLHLYNFYQHL